MPGSRRVILVATAGVILAAGVLVYLVDPAGSRAFPPCPSPWLTGFHCPGCGTLRSLHRLLHGDLAGAL